MSTTIAATSKADLTNSLFSKLDTKQKGYIDEADLKSALGAGNAADSTAAELFKLLDGDDNGQVTKSELSVATEKVGKELDAQLDQSRVGAAAPSGGPGGAQPASSGASEEEATTKYVAAADTNIDGTVSADEEAAYKKLMANADAKAQAQVQEYKDNSGGTGSENVIDVSA